MFYTVLYLPTVIIRSSINYSLLKVSLFQMIEVSFTIIFTYHELLLIMNHMNNAETCLRHKLHYSVGSST